MAMSYFGREGGLCIERYSSELSRCKMKVVASKKKRHHLEYRHIFLDSSPFAEHLRDVIAGKGI